MIHKPNGGSDPTKGCFVKLEESAGDDCAPPIGSQGVDPSSQHTINEGGPRYEC
jgi:hypothetical protein